MKTYLFITLALLNIHPVFLHAKASDEQKGVAQIFTQDALGNPAAYAMVYITHNNKLETYISDSQGVVSVVLKEGTYAISSSMTRPMGDWVDRFASKLATVRIMPDETTSVILPLAPIEDPISSLSRTTLEKMGLAEEVAKYTN